MRVTRLIPTISLVILLLALLVYARPTLALSASPGEETKATHPADTAVRSLWAQTVPTPTLSLVAPTDPQPITTTIDVDVVIANATDLAAFEFDLVYDRSLLQVTGMTLSNLLGDASAGCDPASTRCVIQLGPLEQPGGTAVGAFTYGAGPGFTGDGVLATIHFQPTGLPGSTAVTINGALLADTTAGISLPQTQDATISLIKITPTARLSVDRRLNAAQLEDGAAIAGFSSVWSTSTTYRPENAIDNSQSTVWRTASGQPTNQWIKVQLAGTGIHILDRVILRGSSSTPGLRNFEIRVSTTGTDDADFTTVFTGTVPQDSLAHTFTMPPVAARYVQLFVLDNYGASYTEVYYFQALTRAREGGIVSALEGPPASIAAFSSQNTSLPASNAIDENSSTYWRPASGQLTNQWIKVDLGGNQAVLIDRIRLQSRATGVAVRDFEIRVSTTGTDDADFTTVFTGTAVNDATLQQFSFPPVAARYVQLFVLNNYGSSTGIDVTTFQAITSDGANVARLEGVGAVVVDFSSQTSETYAPRRAIDLDSASHWRTATSQTTNQWLKVRLFDGGSYLVDRALIRGGSGTISPQNFQIRVSNTTLADSDFVTVYSGVLPNDGQPHWVTFPPVQARYAQLFIFNNYGSTQIYVYDFQVFAQDRGAAVVPFADLSFDSDGQIVSRLWEFGDGATSTEAYPTHTYAAPGVYTVTLTVTNDENYTDTVSLAYTVLSPPAASFTWTPPTPNEGQTTSLTDTSQAAENGPVVGWLWQFAHTTSQPTTRNTSTSFPDNNTYPVMLTVTDYQLLTAVTTNTITTLNLPPTVNAGSNQTILVGQSWTLNSTVTDPGIDDRPTLVCDWDFGDGQSTQINNCTTTNVRVSHIYTQTGVYIATLTVTDKDGASASGSRMTTVNRRDTSVIIFGARSVAGNQAELRAGLYDLANWDNVMAGRPVSFTWGTEQLMATTDANGIATAVAPLWPGQEITLTATFLGDSAYNPSSDTNVLRVAPTLPSGDIVFIIDESGSMGDDQAEVQARINNIATQLGFAVDYQFGLVGYGASFGNPYAGAPRIVLPFTNDLVAFSDAIDSMVANGGFEPGFEATITAMSEPMGFRQSAGVCAILITDEDADISSQAPATRADALAALNTRDAVFLGIVNPTFGTTGNDYGPNPGSLSEATGGAVFSITNFRANPGPVLATIVDVCTQAIIQNAPPDLEVDKSASASSAQAGEWLTYTISMENISVQNATGVLLTDTLPLHTTFLAASDGGNAAAGVVTWPAFEVPSGATVTRTVTVQVNPALPAGLELITNTVTAIDDGANGPDPTPANNSASVTVAVVAAPDLAIHKDDGGLAVAPGDTITYTLVYSNVGTQEATGVVITEVVPAHTTFAGPASDPGWDCTDGAPAGTVCQLGSSSLPAGQLASAVFAVNVLEPLPGGVTVITNTAVIADDGTNGSDLNPADNTAGATTPIVPDNQPPTVVADGPYAVDEGSVITVTATGADPDDDPLTYAWDLDNDGIFETPGQTVSFSAALLDGPEVITISVQVTDAGGLTAVDSTTVTVINVAPTVAAITPTVDLAPINTPVTAIATFTDPGVPDTHTAVWSWGDGSTSAGTVDETNGSGSVGGEHVYTEPGVYTVELVVTDDDGDSGTAVFRYIVVYDPNGRYVTGSGCIDSPAGAYVDDPTLTGPANFGFVARYRLGVPDGRIAFSFPAADMNFQSTQMTWLIVSGDLAFFRGVGTINGSGSYLYLASMIDGKVTGDEIDRFRIQIWDNTTGVLIYDSQPGAPQYEPPTLPITCGKVVIH